MQEQIKLEFIKIDDCLVIVKGSINRSDIKAGLYGTQWLLDQGCKSMCSLEFYASGDIEKMAEIVRRFNDARSN